MDFKNVDIHKEFMIYNQMMPRKTEKLSGGEITYRYYKNEKPMKDVTLVFLAGGTGLSDGFFLLYKYFMDKYNILSFNYPKAFTTNQNLADAIAELLKKLNAKNVYLVGQSYGGLIAQVTAKKHPEVIKGLILSGTCSMWNDIDYYGMANIVKMINPEKLKKNLRTDRKIPQWAVGPFMKFAFKKAVKNKDTLDILHSIVSEVKDDLTGEYMALMDTLLGDLMNEFGTHYPADFVSYDNEVMLIFSEEDTYFCKNLKDALIRLMPNPFVIRNLGGGHLALLISFDEYAEKVEKFINERN